MKIVDGEKKDHSTFLEVFFEVRTRLTRVIYGCLNDRTETQDLVQDTFVRLWERKGLLNEVKDIKGYFIRTGRNIALDYRRRLRLAPVLIDVKELEWIQDLSPSVEQEIISRAELQRLRKIIEAMPPRARQVFILSRIEGMSYVQIGLELGISPKTVFNHMVTALERLQDEKPVF
ncbi:RNA polymerase sigma factor [Brucellaceae bacterium C25G]